MMCGEIHDPKETAIAFAGVALVAEMLDCPVVKMDVKTERMPDGTLCTSGVYATGGVALYDEEAAAPGERETLEELNRAIRARVAARLALAGDLACGIYMGESEPARVLDEESEPIRRAREELVRLVEDPDEYLRAEAQHSWELLRGHWGAVEALADALLKHETLTGDRIRQILRERLERDRKPKVNGWKPSASRRAG